MPGVPCTCCRDRCSLEDCHAHRSSPVRFLARALPRPCASSPVRFLARAPLAAVSLMLALFATAPCAHAGSYVWTQTDPATGVTTYSPTYSGGVTSITPAPTDPMQAAKPFTYSGGTYGGSASGFVQPGPQGQSASLLVSAATTTASGTAAPLVARFTWLPAVPNVPGPERLYAPAPPPGSGVIVQQHCRVDANEMSGLSTSTMQCNDGLGGSGSQIGEGYVTVEDTKYTVATVGADGTVSVSCSPSGVYKATTTTGPGQGIVSVSYGAAVTSVITVDLTGQNTTNQALTGQQITATLNGVPSGVTVTSYTWSFDSGVVDKPAKPIKNWDETANGDPTHPQLVPLTDADLKGMDTSGNGISVNPLNFYDEVQENVTVKCAVSLKFADGTTATINAKSVPVAFLKPSLSKWLIDTGYIQASTTNPGYFGLYAAPGSGFPGGEYWHDVTIDVPQPFSGGQGCIVQLITPAFELYKDGSPIVYADPNDKKKGLDNSFPYTQWDLPALGKESDPPQIGVAGVNVPQDQGFRTGTFNDAFVTWVMYKPPVFGTHGHIWVPIRSYPWSTSFTLQWVNNQWTFNAPVPSATTRATPRNPVQTDTPPSWSLIQTNTHH